MLYNFRTTEDSQQWTVDTEQLKWARASSILAAPSVKAVESHLARFVAAEEGPLIPMGGSRFAMAGRQPLDAAGKPQLAIVIIVTVLTSEDGGSAVTFIQANVEIKDFQHQEIKKFRTEVLPAIRSPQNPGRRPVVMPPITADEQKAANGETPEPAPEIKIEQ